MRCVFLSLFFIALVSSGINAQSNYWVNLPSESTVTNGATNGMWFTAPSSFIIKAVKVPDDSMNPFDPQSIAVIKFTGTGASSTLSSNYTVLFLVQDTMAADSIPCNIPVQAGDHIGLLGSRWDASSNAGQSSNTSQSSYSTSINGVSVPLYRLQANSPLNNQPPGPVYSASPTANIIRVEMYVEGCQFPAPNSVSVVDVLCNGDTTGSIAATISGSYAPYVMEWSNGDSNTNSIQNVSAGNYSLTITDSIGCVFDTIINISQPDSVQTELSIIEPLCFGDDNGELAIHVSGGIDPYTVQWGSGSTDTSLTNLTSGVYNLTITDSNGCNYQRNIGLGEPDELLVFLDSINNNKCDDDIEGEIWTTIGGGTGPYSIIWDDPNNSTTSNLTGLATGSYNINVTDDNGCTASSGAPIMVLYNNPVFDLGPPQQLPPNNGVLTLNGPANMDQYLWSTGGTFSNVFVFTPGFYWLQVVDSNTCMAADTIEVLPYDAVGIENIESVDVLMFPNPSTDLITLEMNEDQIFSIEIYDQLGKLVFETVEVQSKLQVDVSEFNEGVYFIRFNGGVISRQFVKK